MPPGTVAMLGPRLIPNRTGTPCICSCQPGDVEIAAVARAWEGLVPELLVVSIDGDLGCAPRNLSRFPAWRVLLVENTNLCHGGLSRIIAYALSEPFQRIVASSREDALILRAAGLGNVSWLPGLFRSRAHVPASAFGVQFFGHELPAAYRAQCLERELRERLDRVTGANPASIAVVVGNGPESGESLISALLSGCAVVAERPAAASGCNSWIMEGRDCVFYETADEAVGLVDRLLRDPEHCREAAAAATAVAQRFLMPEAREQQLVAVVTFADRDGPWSLSSAGAQTEESRRLIVDRLSGYELLQDLHRTHQSVGVWVQGILPECVRTDLAGFPRLRVIPEGAELQSPLIALIGPGEERLSWTRSPVADRVDYVWSLAGGAPQAGRFNDALVEPLSPSVSVVERARVECRVPRKVRRRALATLAVGDKCQQLFREYAWPSWQDYAKHHGCELVVYEKPLDTGARARLRSASWQKCLILEQPELRSFDQVAWVDTDIVMRRDSPSIFDGVPSELVGAVDNDGCPSRVASPRISMEMNRLLNSLLAAKNLPVNARSAYMNRGFVVPDCSDPVEIQAGVWVASPERHRVVFRDVYDRYDDIDRSYEMVPLAYELWQRGLVRTIDWRFNAICIDSIVALCSDLAPDFLRIAYGRGMSPGGDRNALLAAYSALNHAFTNVFWMHFAGGFVQLSGLLRQPPGATPLDRRITPSV